MKTVVSKCNRAVQQLQWLPGAKTVCANVVVCRTFCIKIVRVAGVGCYCMWCGAGRGLCKPCAA